jgi:hypothetical protein
MWTDDYHDHFVRCETLDELEEHCAPLFLYRKEDKQWIKMWSLLQECVKMFGCINVSVYSNDYMKYGDGIEEFLFGFWVNLKEAVFTDDCSLELVKSTILFEDGFMFVRLRDYR